MSEFPPGKPGAGRSPRSREHVLSLPEPCAVLGPPLLFFLLSFLFFFPHIVLKLHLCHHGQGRHLSGRVEGCHFGQETSHPTLQEAGKKHPLEMRITCSTSYMTQTMLHSECVCG